MSTQGVSSDMVAMYPGTQTLSSQRPAVAFDPDKKWCWRRGSAGGEEWHKAVLEAAEAAGLTEALVNEPPTLEQVKSASRPDLSSMEQRPVKWGYAA